MNTTVFHFASAGATEYTAQVTGLSGDYSTSNTGVRRADVTADPQLGSFVIPIGSDSSGKKRSPVCAHVLGDSEGVIQCTVRTTDAAYPYLSLTNSNRQRKIIFGRGIRDNHLGFEFSAQSGGRLKVEQIDLTLTVSENRRI